MPVKPITMRDRRLTTAREEVETLLEWLSTIHQDPPSYRTARGLRPLVWQSEQINSLLQQAQDYARDIPEEEA